jgi:hypothetical protein
MNFLSRLYGKKEPTVTPGNNFPKKKMVCKKCGGKMTLATDGVVVVGGSPGPTPIVKLRCEKCNITRFENRGDIEMELAEENSSSKDKQLYPIDQEPINHLLQSSYSAAQFARFKDSSGNVFTGFILHEDETHIRKLAGEVPVEVRSGLFVRSNVGLVTVMLGVAEEIYETWWNFHVPVIQECFHGAMKQEKLLVVVYGKTADPARVIWTPNVLRDRFAKIIKSLEGMKPWTMNAFDLARNQVYGEYATPQALWAHLALDAERRQ